MTTPAAMANINNHPGFLLERYRVQQNSECMVDGLGNIMYEGRHADTDRAVWIKVVKKTSNSSSKVGSEVTALKRLAKNRARCCRYVDFLESRSQYYIVTRRNPEKVTLLEYLTEHGLPSEAHTRDLFRKVLAAVNECHRAGVTHRSLTLENVLVHASGSGAVDLVDFSSSSCGTEHALFSEQPALTAFTSPEVLAGQLYWGELSDVWSCGALLYALLVGDVPFPQQVHGQRALLAGIRRGLRKFPERVSDLAADCVRRALTPRAEDRPTVEEYLAHPWLRGDECDTPTRSSVVSSPYTPSRSSAASRSDPEDHDERDEH